MVKPDWAQRYAENLFNAETGFRSFLGRSGKDLAEEFAKKLRAERRRAVRVVKRLERQANHFC